MNVSTHAYRRALAAAAATTVLGLATAAPALAQTSPTGASSPAGASPSTSYSSKPSSSSPGGTTSPTGTESMSPTGTESVSPTGSESVSPTATSSTAPTAVKAGTGGQAGQTDDGLIAVALTVGGAAAVGAGWLVTRRKGAHL